MMINREEETILSEWVRLILLNFFIGLVKTLKYAKLSKITSFLFEPAGGKLTKSDNRLQSRLRLRLSLDYDF